MSNVAKVIRLPDIDPQTRARVPPGRSRRDVETTAPVTSLAQHRAATLSDDRSTTTKLRDAVADRIRVTADFARRRITGDYQVDEYGLDEHFLRSVVLPALRPLARAWFRVDVHGVANIPTSGGALIVANHAGVIPWDAMMVQLSVHDRHPQQRTLRLLAADMVFELPVIGEFARKAGHTLACPADAERLLAGGNLVGVFPEGFKGIGKPFSQRYKLQRFGRGGFVSAAVRAGAPIIPCSIVGSEETYPKLADITPLARLLGLPYFPVTPLFPQLGPLGAVPLPSKWRIEFGKPIATSQHSADEADDPMTMFEITDHVRETIQQTLNQMLADRSNPFT